MRTTNLKKKKEPHLHIPPPPHTLTSSSVLFVFVKSTSIFFGLYARRRSLFFYLSRPPSGMLAINMFSLFLFFPSQAVRRCSCCVAWAFSFCLLVFCLFGHDIAAADRRACPTSAACLYSWKCTTRMECRCFFLSWTALLNHCGQRRIWRKSICLSQIITFVRHVPVLSHICILYSHVTMMCSDAATRTARLDWRSLLKKKFSKRNRVRLCVRIGDLTGWIYECVCAYVCVCFQNQKYFIDTQVKDVLQEKASM